MTAKFKISVVTITYKPGYIDTLVQALRDQTLDRSQWEWVLVDDICHLRREAVAEEINGAFSYKHLPSREIKPYSATATAVNTGLAVAEGELVYFMADYSYPHPTCLERHWEIYSRFGPKAFISGPIIDGITYSGRSLYGKTPQTTAGPVQLTVKVGVELITYNEHMPPIPIGIKPGFEHPTMDNLISIWLEPFRPIWPETPGKDWRMGFITPNVIEEDLYLHTGEKKWWYAGRNDSAPLALLRQAGGLEETNQWQHGNLDIELQERMANLGGFYLVDRRAPCFILPHPTRKRESVS